jgi:protein involved in polysaccharide export with SLBB domain
MAGFLVALSGCDVPSFVDPGELAGLRPNAKEPLVVQVLDHLDPVLEETNREFATAQPPLPEDFVTEPADYVVGPGDLLQITVYDLEGPGLQTIKNTRVSGTGNVTLPYLNNVVRAEGLSELELQQSIAEGYRQAGVLDNANVSVSVAEARARAYSVLGSVARPSVYVITDEDFRLLDALTQAGDVQSPFIEELFIYRRTDKPGPRREGAAPAGAMTRPAAPRGGATRPVDDLAPPQSRAKPKYLPNGTKRAVLLQEQGTATDAPAAVALPEDEDPAARVGRIDGKEVVVQPAEAPAAADDTSMLPPPPSSGIFEFNEPAQPDNVRVIRIPLAKLKAGDLAYNVAIRPKDVIVVPPGAVGFYYMSGHVQGIGAYAFQGQKVTLLQALDSARGLDGLAIPQRTDIVRRIGNNKQMFYRVDVAKIAAGQAPDIYLKPNDRVVVGTNFLAPFLAAVRGGFRMTYGFGFLYDRNYAPDQENDN